MTCWRVYRLLQEIDLQVSGGSRDQPGAVQAGYVRRGQSEANIGADSRLYGILTLCRYCEVWSLPPGDSVRSRVALSRAAGSQGFSVTTQTPLPLAEGRLSMTLGQIPDKAQHSVSSGLV